MNANVIMLLIGIALSVVYILMYLANTKKYEAYVNGVDTEFYSLADTFVIGFAIVDMFKLNEREKDYKKRLKLEEFFSKQYLEFNYMVYRAAKISYVALVLPVSFLVSALVKSPVFVLLGLLLAFLMVYYVDLRLDSQIEEQRQEILLDYPNVLSKMALLVNSGMMLREAWRVVSESGNRKLYREMQNAVHNMDNGYSDIQAFEEFADACKINEIKKFVSIICQNIEKGSGELVHIMKELSIEAWTTKKNVARARGASASTKLILPIMISFAGIIIMIIVPIMMGMSM